MAGTETAPSTEPGESQHSNDHANADFGDYVSTEDEEVDLEYIAEPWHKYSTKDTSHVFYPIYVGEVLDQRYLIEHKIGFGGFSTVWMAHDLHSDRDVALKIISSREGDWGKFEIRIQDRIAQDEQDEQDAQDEQDGYDEEDDEN